MPLRDPVLAPVLIRHPIEAMVMGGLEDPARVVAQGVACATKDDPYVKPTEEGKAWLLNDWPGLEETARRIFIEICEELDEEG